MRRPAAIALVWLVGVFNAALAVAQAPPGPPGPYAIDLRGATLSLPSASTFYPAVPVSTLIPGRAFGLDVGGHVYVARLGSARIGVGANVLWLRGTTKPDAAAAVSTSGTTSGTSSATPIAPVIHQTVTTIAPQVSFNFGSRSGWSYFSAGAGVATFIGRSIPDVGPETTRSSGRLRTINLGFGARWFAKRRLGFGFDIRFHMLGAGDLTPGSTLLAASVGVSVR